MIARRLPALLVSILLLGAAPADTYGPDDNLIGFNPSRIEAFKALEEDFARRISTEGPEKWMRRLASRPHHAGSDQGRANAAYIKGLFESWGFDTKLETYYVLLPEPIERSVRLLEPTQFTARLEEPALEEDPSTKYLSDALPVYNAFSADGDVTAELVYVNQGIPKDYEDLDRMGIDVAGKIVIARYGGSWRGIKPKVAAEYGAIGCILYSDPRDDGYYVGDPYPDGSMRGEYGAQRGSVVDMPLLTGDPLTPFAAATEDAERLSVEASKTIMPIPVLPISYADALPLLRALAGPVAPENWRGGLPMTYHVGPGPAVVNLKLKFDWSTRPAINVIATLKGESRPDEWIMRGNHHDAWVFGARDPISGLVSMLEEARGIGALHAQGWRPKRTIVYAAWDAEEQGLMGSTEWVEDHQAELQKKLAVYINTDSNSRGFLSAGGSHSLERFVAGAASAVTDPQTGVTVAERAMARARLDNPDFDMSKGLSLDPLGSGSDYTPFLQHSGVASLNLSFHGEAPWGAYHSVYDTYTHFEQNSDPGYQYAATLAELGGRVTLRLAEADILPFQFERLSEKIAGYMDDIKEVAEKMRSETDRTNALIRDSVFALTADPLKVSHSPDVAATVPHLNFAPLENAIRRFDEAAEKYDAALTDWQRNPTPMETDSLNAVLIGMEQELMLDDGLPRRPWFRHSIYAPGFYTGYGVKTIPSVREAVEQRAWLETEQQVVAVAAALDRATVAVSRAVELLTNG